MSPSPSRRDVLVFGAAALGAGALPGNLLEEPVNAQANPQQPESQASGARPKEPFGYCFNTSTIRGQRLPLTQVVDITAKAGWNGIEPWMDEITRHLQGGGKLADLRKQIADGGLQVPSAIGFAEWIVDDAERRKKGMEQAKRDMDMVAQIGGTRIAAPPAGAKDVSIDLRAAAERYRELCELGRQMGVVPQVEVWGFSQTFKRLGEAVFVAIESGHPDACVLADPYHVYKGGSNVESVRLLSAKCLQHFHMNDYPADPPRADPRRTPHLSRRRRRAADGAVPRVARHRLHRDALARAVQQGALQAGSTGSREDGARKDKGCCETRARLTPI